MFLTTLLKTGVSYSHTLFSQGTYPQNCDLVTKQLSSSYTDTMHVKIACSTTETLYSWSFGCVFPHKQSLAEYRRQLGERTLTRHQPGFI